ncbi:MAG TPA: FAD binding domain-containing protein [Thermoanaerobaculia bacterium]|nr:FAD binding domain-containing protein [Thermoanaerobaculia bacterium]
MNPAELALYPFERPATLAELCRTLSARAGRRERTVLLAGGTDWLVERGLAPPENPDDLPLVLDVSRLPELRGIQVAKERAVIGAAATFFEIRSHPVLLRRAPVLTAMAREVGAIQIQARGTLGGNLATASPAADGAAALMALDADVVLASVHGERRVPLTQFFTGYRATRRAEDEVIVRVEFVLPRTGAHQAWRKVGTRAAQAISKVALAAVAELERGRGGRAGFGMASVAPVTASLPTVRALVLAPSLASVSDEELDAATRHDIAPIDDIRSTAAYRAHVASALVKAFFRALRAATGP